MKPNIFNIKSFCLNNKLGNSLVTALPIESNVLIFKKQKDGQPKDDYHAEQIEALVKFLNKKNNSYYIVRENKGLVYALTFKDMAEFEECVVIEDVMEEKDSLVFFGETLIMAIEHNQKDFISALILEA